MTLVIDSTTRISRNGHTATAADLKVGDRAAALYATATLLAQRIEAVGGNGGHH